MNPADLLNDWDVPVPRKRKWTPPLGLPTLNTAKLEEIFFQNHLLDPALGRQWLSGNRQILQADLAKVIHHFIQFRTDYEAYHQQQVRLGSPEFKQKSKSEYAFATHAFFLSSETAGPRFWDEILPMLSLEPAAFDFWFDPSIHADIGAVLAKACSLPGGIEKTVALCKDARIVPRVRAYLAEALGLHGSQYRSDLPKIAASISELLAFFTENPDPQSRQLNGLLAYAIVNLRIEAAMPALKIAFENNAVQAPMLGSWEDAVEGIKAPVNNWYVAEDLGVVERYEKWHKGQVPEVKPVVLKTGKAKIAKSLENAGRAFMPPKPKKLPFQAKKTPGRNDLCHCGSGLKYKKCHGK
jgi:hypothetical protein